MTPNEPKDGRYFVAVDTDGGAPVMASTPERCAQLVTREWDLPYSCQDIDHWEAQHGRVMESGGKRHWMKSTPGKTYDSVSIYEVSERNGRLAVSL